MCSMFRLLERSLVRTIGYINVNILKTDSCHMPTTDYVYMLFLVIY